MRDELSLRVYLENAAHADRGGWLELPVAPERLDGFMGGVLGVGGAAGMWSRITSRAGSAMCWVPAWRCSPCRR